MTSIAQIIVVIGIVYLVNRFLVPYVFNILIGFHEKYNSKNLNRQPIKFVMENKAKLIKGFSIFYWVAGAIIIYGILWIE
jgi:hypothetical protein